jgi:ubiquinone/menaquinone biosynthesis C-methylase UbiE
MDNEDDARDYDRMDHTEVNRQFVDDLLAAGLTSGTVLDLGTGTAQIPVELCRRNPDVTVRAVDLSPSMLDLARANVVLTNLVERIELLVVDAKDLPYGDGEFEAVISNSIVHHIAEPDTVFREAVRVTSPGGLLFFRDLIRPDNDAAVDRHVATYAAGANDHQRDLFAESLRSSLTLVEVRQLVAKTGFDADSVSQTSDRHWTFCARRPA